MDRSMLPIGLGLDMPIMHDSDRYEHVKDIGSGNFGLARLMRDKQTKELVAVKYIERGDKTNWIIVRPVLALRAIVKCAEVLKHVYFVPFGFANGRKEKTLLTIGIQIADVWSCGVTLFVMLVGAYPFEDPKEPKNVVKTVERIVNVQYSIPDNIEISCECRDLISRIFVADPSVRITIPEIQKHGWFLKNLPADLMDENTRSTQFQEPDQPMQNTGQIMQIIAEATVPAAGTHSLDSLLPGFSDMEDYDDDYYDESDCDLEVDSSGEIVIAMQED
ncbi:hypothetical protein Syun_005274 [Stephania yunnanensis]|uniref:Protein kinase domain-containing protein n=1 Tax=Stephania yunnanensis TaxID=152371 RepID=A0AAP0L5Y1_9MAGN